MFDRHVTLWVVAVLFYGLLCMALLALGQKTYLPGYRRWISGLLYLLGLSFIPVVCLLLLWLPEELV